MSIIDILDTDSITNIVLGFSNTYYELSMACVCRCFRDILEKKRGSKRICTSIRWILSSQESVKWTLKNYGIIPYPISVSNIAAAEGLLPQLKLIENKYNVLRNEETCAIAALNGHLHVLKWLRANGCPWNRYTATSAASGGFTDVLYWARTNGCEWNEDACTAAAGGIAHVMTNRYRVNAYAYKKNYKKTKNGGHLSTLIWLIENGCPVHYKKVVSASIFNNHINILEWIRVYRKFDIDKDPFLCDEAAQSGHVDVFSYLLNFSSNHNTIEFMPYISAATRGHVDIMDYALNYGCQLPRDRWENAICNIGAYYGHINVVKWGVKNGTLYDRSTCSRAAASGNLDILIYLRSIGCEWDETTCSQASQYGHFNIIKWARENGCPWDVYTFSLAAEKGDINILEWLYQNNCPWNENSCASATNAGKLDILIWLREKGCPWNDSTFRAALRQERYFNRFDILKWVRDNNCPYM